MTVSKPFLTTAALAFAMLFGGGVYVFMNLGSLAKPLTEKIASDTLGVKVSIGGMEIALAEKRVTVSGIKIANPKGFSKPHALKVGAVSVALENVAAGLVDFKDISIANAHVFVEVSEKGTNLQALKNGMTQSEPDPDAKAPKVIIRRFALNEASLNPSVTLIGDQDLQPITIAPITLTGIGVKENGIVAREAIVQVMEPLLKIFTREAGKAGFYQGLSPDALKELGVKGISGIKDKVQDSVGGAVGGGLKKLFQ